MALHLISEVLIPDSLLLMLKSSLNLLNVIQGYINRCKSRAPGFPLIPALTNIIFQTTNILFEPLRRRLYFIVPCSFRSPSSHSCPNLHTWTGSKGHELATRLSPRLSPRTALFYEWVCFYPVVYFPAKIRFHTVTEYSWSHIRT